MTERHGPLRWANTITTILNAGFGADRFPVNVPQVARDYSHQRYPDDPIAVVKGNNLPGFDGALVKAPPGKKGWGIFFNDRITSPGRIAFTQGHELGHYLVHRHDHPQGFECRDEDVVRWDSAYGQLEYEANQFAATLLMPLDDFRRQIPPRDRADLNMLSACADHYGVSLLAATLRWLEYTERRAVLVVSRDGYMLWSRASRTALRTGAFFRTGRTRPPVPIPVGSLAARQDMLIDGRVGIEIAAGIWLPEALTEMTLFSEQYDVVTTLLSLERASGCAWDDAKEEPDVFDRFTGSL